MAPIFLAEVNLHTHNIIDNDLRRRRYALSSSYGDPNHYCRHGVPQCFNAQDVKDTTCWIFCFVMSPTNILDVTLLLQGETRWVIKYTKNFNVNQ